MAVNALAVQANYILDAARDALAEATTGQPAPAHIFRSHGPSTLELCCEGQVAVWLEEINHDPVNATGVEPVCDPAENYAVWVLGVYRCADADTPTADGEDDLAEQLLIDAWALLTEVYDRNRQGTLLPGCDCETVRLGRLTPAPEGSTCVGWEFRITVDLSCLTDTGS